MAKSASAATVPMRLADPGKPREPMRFRFTKGALARLEPGQSRYYVYDLGVDGLALMVTPKAVKSWYYAKRIDGRYRRVKIGAFPEVTIEQARTRATQYAGDVAFGKNPADERQQARAATTFGELWRQYLERHAKVHKRTWEEDQRIYDRHLKQWAGRRLVDLKRHDVQALHQRMGKTAPTMANRTLALVSKVFSFAASCGHDGNNPAKGVKRYAEASRERYLDAEELPRFIAAVEADEDPLFRDYFNLLLFTGQRRQNVASMRWDEVDLKRKVWTIPAEKYKTGNAVEVPLVIEAVDIIKSRQDENEQRDEPSEYVFASKRKNAKVPHLYEPKGAFTRICERAGIRDLHVHDLRRTVASWATMQGVPYPVVARMVGHKVQGVTGVYARFDLTAVREGFERTVSAMLAAVCTEERDKQKAD